MLSARIPHDTQNIKCNGKTYCAYCGKEIEPDYEYDEYERYGYYHCDCEDASKELEIIRKTNDLRVEIARLNMHMPKPRYEVVTQMRKK